MSAMFAGPALATTTQVGAGDTHSAATGLTQPSTSSTSPIIVKAKWEMREERSGDCVDSRVGNWTSAAYTNGWWSEDNFVADGAQLMPSGDNTIDTNYAVCAVVAHPDLKNNLSRFSVSADINYPNVHGIGTTKQFCGQRITEIDLSALSVADGLKLACSGAGDNVMTSDPGLATRYSNYTWSDICEEISQQEAVVFCGISTLSYEAPAGDYAVTAIATVDGAQQVTAANNMNYLPLVAFKTDFTSVLYGNNVLIGNLATVGGDTSMTTPLAPTVQETGNEVLTLHVAQDDMGFDQRTVNNTPIWNVHYKTRLGSTPLWASLATYDPSVKKPNAIIGGGYTLDNMLDLSETQKLDFGILVDKYPYAPGTPYSGSLVITATGQIYPCN